MTKQFGPSVITAFERMKQIFDPDDRMNPGKVVTPYELDQDLRLGSQWTPANPTTWFGYPDDEGRFQRAVMRCVGVESCRRNEGGVMCPSYMVTKEEEHSTRGRARLLFEMLQGHQNTRSGMGWLAFDGRSGRTRPLPCL